MKGNNMWEVSAVSKTPENEQKTSNNGFNKKKEETPIPVKVNPLNHQWDTSNSANPVVPKDNVAFPINEKEEIFTDTDIATSFNLVTGIIVSEDDDSVSLDSTDTADIVESESNINNTEQGASAADDSAISVVALESENPEVLEEKSVEVKNITNESNDNKKGDVMVTLIQQLLNGIGNGFSLNLSKTDDGKEAITIKHSEASYHPKTPEQAEKVINAIQQRVEAEKILNEALAST